MNRLPPFEDVFSMEAIDSRRRQMPIHGGVDAAVGAGQVPDLGRVDAPVGAGQVPNLRGVGVLAGDGQVRVPRASNLVGRRFLQCPYCFERVRSERQYNIHLEACFALHQ